MRGILTWSARVVPSEGSHSTFAPRGWKQRALQAFAEEELGQHCEVCYVMRQHSTYSTLSQRSIECRSLCHHSAAQGQSQWSTIGQPVLYGMCRWRPATWTHITSQPRWEHVACGSGLERIYRFCSRIPLMWPTRRRITWVVLQGSFPVRASS